MKKIFSVLACFVLLLFVFTPLFAYEKEMEDLASYIANNMDKIGRKRVAVMDFNDNYGKPMELGKYLSDELTQFLKRKAKGFEILERAQLKTIINQSKIIINDPIDPDVVKRLGQVGRVGAIVTGSVRPFQDSVRVEINLINTYSGNVIGSTKADILKTQRMRELLKEKRGDLVGFWRFNDPNNLGFDSSGYGNHGTPMYAKVQFIVEGISGGSAYFFEGKTDIPAGIIVKNSDSLDIKTQEITLAAWVKLDGNNIDNGNAIVSKCCEPYALFAWLGSPANGISTVLSSEAVYSNYVIPYNVWNHIAVTYNGSIVKFYHNGRLVVSKPFKKGLSSDTGDLYIGGSPFGIPEDFSGLIDDVRIYNRALSDREIYNIFTMR